jgi:hypothetical protein
MVNEERQQEKYQGDTETIQYSQNTRKIFCDMKITPFYNKSLLIRIMSQCTG